MGTSAFSPFWLLITQADAASSVVPVKILWVWAISHLLSTHFVIIWLSLVLLWSVLHLLPLHFIVTQGSVTVSAFFFFYNLENIFPSPRFSFNLWGDMYVTNILHNRVRGIFSSMCKDSTGSSVSLQALVRERLRSSDIFSHNCYPSQTTISYLAPVSIFLR